MHNFYGAGSDMIILVGMIVRWVVDLVIPMKGPMVDIWVGHLEAIEVVLLVIVLTLFQYAVVFCMM